MVNLYRSLSLTGKGHATDVAIMMESPVTVHKMLI
ncbi:hypothetical protein ACNKHK_20145 [Shigella flexneri]